MAGGKHFELVSDNPDQLVFPDTECNFDHYAGINICKLREMNQFFHWRDCTISGNIIIMNLKCKWEVFNPLKVTIEVHPGFSFQYLITPYMPLPFSSCGGRSFNFSSNGWEKKKIKKTQQTFKSHLISWERSLGVDNWRVWKYIRNTYKYTLFDQILYKKV